jgi:hypothetical protein
MTRQPRPAARLDRPQLLFIAASILWAAVIIDPDLQRRFGA